MFERNVAVAGFPFSMLSSSTGAATAGLSVTGWILKDGGTQAALTNPIADELNGQYSVNLTAGEMDAVAVGLLFTAPGAVSVGFTIKTIVTVAIPEVDVVKHLGVDCPATPIAGAPLVALSDGTGAGQVDLAAGAIVQVTNVAVTATLTDRTDFALGADGLDAVSTSEPGAGSVTTFREKLIWLFMRFGGNAVKSSSQIKVKSANNTTVLTTQAISAVGNDETQGAIT
jgi:hypothetical protein